MHGGCLRGSFICLEITTLPEQNPHPGLREVIMLAWPTSRRCPCAIVEATGKHLTRGFSTCTHGCRKAIPLTDEHMPQLFSKALFLCLLELIVPQLLPLLNSFLEPFPVKGLGRHRDRYLRKSNDGSHHAKGA